MEYLRWNIEKLEALLLQYGTLEKIATMRATEYELGESSIGGIVSVRVYPDYSLSIEYGQSGTSDGYPEKEVIHMEFSRETIFEQFDDLEFNEDEDKYYDKYNQEFFTFPELVDLAVSNGSPSLFERTEAMMKVYIETFKENAEQCSHCGSTDIIKNGTIRHADGKHQRWICKKCNHMSTSEWTIP